MTKSRSKLSCRPFSLTPRPKNGPVRTRRKYERFHLLESLEGREMAAADTAVMIQHADISIATLATGPVFGELVGRESDHAANASDPAVTVAAEVADRVVLEDVINDSAQATVDAIADAEWTNPDEFRAALDSLLQRYKDASDAVEQEAQLQHQEIIEAAAQQESQLQADQQAQLQLAEQEHASAVARANRNAEIERAAAEQARVAAVVAAQHEASLKINAEAAKRDAEIHRNARNADQQISNEARARDAAVAHHHRNTSQQLTAAQQNAARQSTQATAQRDAEIRDARSWADRAISNLPRWARGLARFVRPILNTVESTVNRVTTVAQNALRQIQSNLQTLTRNILAARDRLVASVRSAYDSAVRGILSARDRLVAGARNAFNHISNALVATRDRMIRAANDTASAIRSGAERTRSIAVTTADGVLRTAQAAIVDNGRTSLEDLGARTRQAIGEFLNDKKEKADRLWVTTRNDITRFGRGVVMHGVRTAETLGTFVRGTGDSIARSGNEFVERIQSASSLRDIGVAAWVFGRDVTTSIAQQGVSAAMQYVANDLIHTATTIVDAMVPDALMRELMRTNLGWYADQNAAPTATVNAHFGGAPLYYINGVTTGLQGQNYLASDQNMSNDHGAMEQAESLSLRLGRAVHVVWNRTDGMAQDLAESVADRLWHPLLPQHNAATKALSGMLLRHARNHEQVSLVAHSQGNIIVRNALRTLYHLGFENWVRDQVRWVGAGSPVSHADVEFSVRYTRIVNDGDPINVVADYQQFRDTGREGKPVGIDEHSMLLAYMPSINPNHLWSSGNHQVGTMPEGADPARFALHESLWSAREAREIVPYITHQRQLLI